MTANDTINSLTGWLPFARKDNCNGVYRTFLTIIIIIFVYFIILRSLFPYNYGTKDKMNVILFDSSFTGQISLWPISHFVLFFILGVLFPHCDILVLSGGVLWEIWEEVYGRYFDKKTSGPVPSEGGTQVQYSNGWWRGSVKDIVFDVLGYYCGKLLRLNLQIPYVNDYHVIPK